MLARDPIFCMTCGKQLIAKRSHDKNFVGDNFLGYEQCDHKRVPPTPIQEPWVSVETPPDYYLLVICWHKEYGFVIAWRANDGEQDFYTIQMSEQILILPPTHWMPLPQPPQTINQ